jgi:AraC-like DNA-binding protein
MPGHSPRMSSTDSRRGQFLSGLVEDLHGCDPLVDGGVEVVVEVAAVRGAPGTDRPVRSLEDVWLVHAHHGQPAAIGVAPVAYPVATYDAKPSGVIAPGLRLRRGPGGAQIGLDELASVAGIGKFRLIRLFREHTGLPPHALQIAHRVRKARRLLEAGEPVADIAAATGSPTRVTSVVISSAASA